MVECNYYRKEKRIKYYSGAYKIPYTVGICMGTKEMDECRCGGDRRCCDFYPEYRVESENLVEVRGGIPMICRDYLWDADECGDYCEGPVADKLYLYEKTGLSPKQVQELANATPKAEWRKISVCGAIAFECSNCQIQGSPRWKRCPVCESKMKESDYYEV